MPWIESHTVLKRHRKLKELAKDARLRPVYAMGHLHSLWHEALEQQEDGDLTRWSDQFIADACDYPGNAPQWVRLLRKHGWLNGRIIHDWLDYAGKYLESKYRTSNHNRLVEIWEKHGKKYEKSRQDGKDGKSDNSLSKDKPPNQPYQPNLDNRTGNESARTGAGKTSTAGRCDYTYRDGPQCPAARVQGAYMCKEHIDKCRELKDQRRTGGFQQAGEILGEKR